MRNVEEIAKRLCNGESCFCDFDCGIEKDYSMPLYGLNTVCPLSKYNLPKDRINASWRDAVTYQEVLSVCAACEHAVVEGNVITRIHDVCLDCPVFMTEEALIEGMAEAQIS